jgi:DNA topoisomerase-1
VARTRRVDCTSSGISRRRRGRGFSYLGPDGRPIGDHETLERIGALAIPPAWRDVWICTDARGHIQATGVDAAGRKQYRYHDDWRRRRDAAKFDAMVAFARALPRVRRRVARDLRGDLLDETRVLACAVRLLDIGLFRIGSEDYAKQNGSYGLTTLRKDHVRIDDGMLLFDFAAKAAQRRRQAVRDAAARAVVAELKQRRGGGQELLAYQAAEGWVDVKAEDVNGYIRQAAGGEFTAKDFRTWNATALCAVALAARAGSKTTRASRSRAVREAIEEVAFHLGNTPAVCRSSYIDPRVFDRFDAGVTLAGVRMTPARVLDDGTVVERPIRESVRRAVLELLVDDTSLTEAGRS